jgi:hypothetical protein
MILDLMIERTATVVAVKAVAAKASTINKFIMFDCLECEDTKSGAD